MLVPHLCRLVLILGVAAFSLPAAAQQTSGRFDSQRDEAGSDGGAKADLLSVIDDVSTLATKTRMNADYVPGFLSVLDGDELSALGVHRVWEALALVPGVQIDRANTGGLRVAIRGFQHGNGNVKLMLNSAPMNNAYAGYSNILYIPIAQVERIEVIRGPGSALYGEYAFAGVIHVITRKKENQVYLRAGSGDTHGAGMILSARDPSRDWSLSLNAAGWDTDGVGLTTGTDRLHAMGLESVSQAPGEVNNSESDRLAVLSLDYKRFSLLAQYSRNRTGTFFGALNVLPEPNEGAHAALSEQSLLQIRQQFDPLPDLSAELKLSWSRFVGNWAEEILPAGAPYPLGSQNLYPDGVFMEDYIRLGRQEVEFNLDWRGWSGHRWQLDLSTAHIEIEDAWWIFNGDLDTFAPLAAPRRYRGDQNYIEKGAERSIQSVAVQDQFQLFEPLTVTAGLRYDSYSDVGDNLSPRLALVWELSDAQLLKAQYAEAFFPPTLFQVYGNTGSAARGAFAVDAETVATTELGYIYRRGTGVARLTLYSSQVRNLIVIESSSYLNRGHARQQGVEAEWEQRLSPAWKMTANLSYNESRDKDLGGALAGSADWLGNLSLFYRPVPSLLLTTHWRYVSDRHRSVDDPRTERLKGFHDVSLGLNWFDVGAPGFTLRAGVKNLLAQGIKSPAPADTYSDDYPLLDERTWWMQLSYEWR